MAVDRDPNLYDRNDSVAGHASTDRTTMDHTTSTYNTTDTTAHRRGHSTSWAWVLAALIALAAIFGFFFFDSDYRSDVPATGAIERPAGDPGAVTTVPPANRPAAPAAPAAPVAPANPQ